MTLLRHELPQLNFNFCGGRLRPRQSGAKRNGMAKCPGTRSPPFDCGFAYVRGSDAPRKFADSVFKGLFGGSWCPQENSSQSAIRVVPGLTEAKSVWTVLLVLTGAMAGACPQRSFVPELPHSIGEMPHGRIEKV